jgi:trimeric autotransporter adhesin
MNGSWVEGFGYPIPGLDGAGGCAIEFNGDLVCAGQFDLAGNILANNLARWDGAQWHSMTDGTTSRGVVGFAIYHGELIAAGGFVFTEGGTAGLARWDGTRWQPFGTAPTSSVRAITVSGDSLVVGGSFTSMGGVPARNIALWDGSSWSALGNGLDSYPGAVAVYDGSIIAGGWFYIHRWNGSTWTDIAPGIYGDVWCMGVHGGKLFAGGNLSRVGTVFTNGIASWDGAHWSPLGSGFGGAGAYGVSGIVSDGVSLIVSGIYETAGGIPAHNIARWDGGQWHAYGDGCDGGLNGVALFDGGIAIIGDLASAGSVPARGVARWNGAEWSALGAGGRGLDQDVDALAVMNGELIAGGWFTNAGGLSPTYGLARWDGSTWRFLDGGLHLGSYAGRVNGMLVSGGILYVVGSFDRAGNVAVSNIASWDGTQWASVAGGVEGTIEAITIYNGHLVVGGWFETAGGHAATRIAILNQTGWGPLGSGMYRSDLMGGNSAFVSSLTVHGNDLIAGGSFDQAGTVDAANIARWNGTSWSPLGQGIGQWGPYMSDEVATLASQNGILYAGGSFSTAGGGAAASFASWNGDTWSQVGGGTNGHLSLLFPTDGGIVVGGYFDSVGGTTAHDIALWDGQAWSSFDSGVTNGIPGLWHSALAVAEYRGDLYVGGAFTRAGERASCNIAAWRSSTSDAEDIAPASEPSLLAPNPYRPGAPILLSTQGGERMDGPRAQVLDIQGRCVAELAIDRSNGTVRWDGRAQNGRDLPEGIYLLRVGQDRAWSVRKIVLDR